ncbi:MAG TPA: helix-turn-helix domain-containing GNAT family N-acetyltransferase [Gaiella sp.]
MRRFNRIVTQRVGALDEAFLARGRPLGQARVLWEIGPDGADVRALRTRLGLDSGYLSRVLGALGSDGLVTVGRSQLDGRVRTARLTPAGLAECAELDRRNDAVASSILDPLEVSQRTRLVGAMAEVERLLTASLVRIEPCAPRHRHAHTSLDAYFSELDARFNGGFDRSRANLDAPSDLVPPNGLLLVATLAGEPVGCGVLRHHDVRGGRPAWSEIKRLWVAPSVRGIGLGRRLLIALEGHAASSGAPVVRLDTNRVLTEAIAMYRAHGYRETRPFNDNPYAHHWFEKRLAAKGRRRRQPATAARTRSTNATSGTAPAQA